VVSAAAILPLVWAMRKLEGPLAAERAPGAERDEELIRRARDILSTLADDAWGGPAGGMLDYDDGLAATERFLEVIEPRDLDDYLAIDSLRSFAEDELEAADDRDELEERRAQLGWTP
jgi:hypothetical protein